MAIDKVAEPNPTAPLTLANAYQAQNLKMTALSQAFTGRNPVDGSTLHAGTVMMIGSVLYKVTTDTTITGTPSLYVKITPSVDGLTATASFVANLTGVSWNHAYGGYYDGTANLYLFDEALAVMNGVVSVSRMLYGERTILSSESLTTAVATVSDMAIGESRIVTWNFNHVNGVTSTLSAPSSGYLFVSSYSRSSPSVVESASTTGKGGVISSVSSSAASDAYVSTIRIRRMF